MSLRSRARATVVVTRANTRLAERPDRRLRALWALRPYGTSVLGAVAAAVARYPDRVALIDEESSTTYRDLWGRSNALGHALTERGLGPGSRVGLLSRNSRFFVEGLLATATSGADAVLLNTGFAAPQLADVAAAERLDAILCEDEYAEMCRASGVPTVLDGAAYTRAIRECPWSALPPPQRPGRLIILTSGTTGPPKGATRPPGGEVEGTAALLGRVPLRACDTRVVAAPLFHGWGLTHLLLGLGMSATVVVHRRFDPELTLRSVAAHRAGTLVAVPVMVQRILALDPVTLAAVDTGPLRVVCCSGSALPGRTVTEALRRFGPVLYNVYGSTEVAVATVATPADLARDPTTAGRPAPGVMVRVLDDDGRPLPPGESGRVFVRGALRFQGYTTGGGKEVVDGLLSSGDVGHFDEHDCLVLHGREDDMIVSGGENVYPQEIEELLAGHPAIQEVAVIGVPHSGFGQALKACVVLRPEAELDGDGVQAYVRDHLARFKVPREVEFLTELPRNTTGKILRRKLS